MSIHFRSRIANNNGRPVVNGANVVGWCCSLNAQTVLARCLGGGFFPGATDGNNCNVPVSCTGGPVSLTSGGACCYWKKNNQNYIQVCETTEDNTECFFKNEGLSENLYSQFYPGRVPEIDGGDIVGNGVKIYDQNFSDGCIPDDNSGCLQLSDIIGHCCRKIGTEVNCSLVPKKECFDGVWVPPTNGVLTSCSSSPCSDILFTQNRTPPILLNSEKDNDLKPFKKIPNIGDFYQGGMFVGIFEEGKSVVYGNKNTGNPYNYIARENGTKRSWILIADTNDFISNKFNDEDETPQNIQENYHDGLYNTDNLKNILLHTTISLYKNNGFNDWYIPSQDELALYFKNIKEDNMSAYSLLPTKYMSSTPFSVKGTQSINQKYFIYIQSAKPEDYGKVSLLERKQGIANIRLFRRIYLVS